MPFLMECWFSVPGQSDGFLTVKFGETGLFDDPSCLPRIFLREWVLMADRQDGW